MLGPHKLIVDEWAEIWDLLEPHADASFWQWPETFDPQCFYIVGRVVLEHQREVITELATRYPGRIVFSNPAEGSETILYQLKKLRILDHVRDGRIGLIASGDIEPGFDYCQTDCYFTNIVEYTENQQSMTWAALTQPAQRPWDFLFLNGRLRPHRKYLIDQLSQRGMLNRALWSNLESRVSLKFTSQLTVGDTEPIRLLPAEYEIERAHAHMLHLPDSGFVKQQLFGDTWGDAIVNPRCYTDTWFSLVTETIFDYPHTFRTEKIWKPIMMQHPFLVAANQNYYRDLRRAGFRTFEPWISEDFDQIDRPDERLERIIEQVIWICEHDLAADLWTETRDVCKYNCQLLIEYNQQQRLQLPNSLKRYLDERS